MLLTWLEPASKLSGRNSRWRMARTLVGIWIILNSCLASKHHKWMWFDLPPAARIRPSLQNRQVKKTGLIIYSSTIQLDPVSWWKRSHLCCPKMSLLDFPGDTVDKNLMQTTGSIPECGRFHMLWATKPMHNYWALALQPESHNCWAHMSQQESPPVRSLRTTRKSSPHSPQLEKACAQQKRPNAAKNK